MYLLKIVEELDINCQCESLSKPFWKRMKEYPPNMRATAIF